MARLQLIALRHGIQLRLAGPTDELLALLDLAGLTGVFRDVSARQVDPTDTEPRSIGASEGGQERD